MVYLSVDSSWIRVLLVSRSILGQYEASVFEKKYQADLIIDGKITNIDLFASAVKEVVFSIEEAMRVKEKDVLITLPQEAFRFMRMTVPADIAPTALSAFVKDRASAAIDDVLEDGVYDFFPVEQGEKKEVFFFSVKKGLLDQYREAFQLIDMRLVGIVPEPLAYFKLFDKTLRKDKNENIVYARYEKERVIGYLYDSLGLVSEARWEAKLEVGAKIEQALKQKIDELGEKSIKINRLILSGEESENIRQDTFTKEVGVWTNPLKRIIPQFYDEHMRSLVLSNGKPFPILVYDACFGSFIFHKEHKNFSLMKNKKATAIKKLSFPNIPVPKKELLLFAASFSFSFIVFVLVSQMRLGLFLKQDNGSKKEGVVKTKQAVPTVIPTPSFKKEELKIKILNGSGVSGRAINVKELLREKGYQEVLTGNADNFDYEVSELKVKKTKKDAVVTIKGDLKQNISLFNESFLEATDAADVVIIIGKNFK